MRIFYTIALFVLWLVLSASYNLAHVAFGAIVAFVVVWLSPKAPPQVRRFSWTTLITYVPWLFVRVLRSGFHVSRLILQPGLPIKHELVKHKTDLTSDGELVVLGNSITLTPGTITVEVTPGELIVHAIDSASQQDLTEGALDAQVGRLFLPLSTEESGR